MKFNISANIYFTSCYRFFYSSGFEICKNESNGRTNWQDYKIALQFHIGCCRHAIVIKIEFLNCKFPRMVVNCRRPRWSVGQHIASCDEHSIIHMNYLGKVKIIADKYYREQNRSRLMKQLLFVCTYYHRLIKMISIEI